jgi:Winged helix DNA-binding domain
VAERTLTQRDLNRALLARQLLLERVRLPLPRVLERLAGIQNQYAPNGYIRLSSCVEGFRRDDLTRALERRSVVQATLMRDTIHLVSARDYGPFLAALREPLQDWSSRIHRGTGDADRAALVARVHEAMRGRTCSRADLEALRGDAGPAAWQTIHTDAALLRAPPSGTWNQRRAHLFELAEDRLGTIDVEPGEARVHLVRRYLAAFGPASRADVAQWAGVRARDLEDALAHTRLRRFRDEDGKELVDLPRAPLPPPDKPAPVRFLPTWDAVLLVHARRTGVLPERFRPMVFSNKNPPSVPTFLVDGEVAGTWRYEKGRVQLEPFEKLDRATLRGLREEAGRLAELHA